MAKRTEFKEFLITEGWTAEDCSQEWHEQGEHWIYGPMTEGKLKNCKGARILCGEMRVGFYTPRGACDDKKAFVYVD